MPVRPSLRGIVLMIASMAVFTVNDTLMKQAAASLPAMQVVAVRGLFATLAMLVAVAALGERRAIGKVVDGRVTTRSLVEFLSISAFITALVRFPIADVIAIAQAAPMILAILAAIVFRERIGPARAGLIAAGFVGALMITQPGGDGFDPLILIAFLCAGAQAVRDLLQRRIDPAVPSAIIALSTCGVVAIAAGAATLVFGAAAMTTGQIGALAMAGLCLAMGHLLLIMAFRAGEMTIVAPFGYSAVLWAGISGFVVFGDRLDGLTLAGIAVLVASGATLARMARAP